MRPFSVQPLDRVRAGPRASRRDARNLCSDCHNQAQSGRLGMLGLLAVRTLPSLDDVHQRF